MINDKLFNTRSVDIDGRRRNFLWISDDAQCFSIISNDWVTQGPAYFANTRGNKVAVQAGGNCGLYPYLLSRHFNRVITFEPDPMNFYCLTHNCPSSNIVKVNMALGEQHGIISIQRDISNVGMTKVANDGATKVYCTTLDSFGLQELDFIQWDLEGFELPALYGAIETIQRCRPTISLEITSDDDEIHQLMKDLNYKFVQKVNMDSIFVPKEAN